MVDPSEIVEALVAMLRDIPELVEELDGDDERIYAYHDRAPQNLSLETAKALMIPPSIMVAWTGTLIGKRWKHSIGIFLRAKSETVDPPNGYYTLYRLIMKGIPATLGGGQPVLYATVHASCYPIGDPDESLPIQRQMDVNGYDYFEISMSFTEIGDD